nr:histidine kinase [Lachnospiraceae bacterium]
MMQHFFRKRLLRYTLAILIPTLILVIWSIASTARSTIRNINAESINSSQRIAQATDTMISDVVYQHELIAGNPQLALSLRKILSADSFYYDDYLYFNTLTGLIRSLKNAFPYVSSTYLELDSYDKFFSSEDGISIKADYYDQSWLETIETLSNTNPQYAELRGLSLYSILPERDIITIYQRMTTLKGTIVVNISYSSMLQRLNLQKTIDEELFYMLNENGDIIASTDEDTAFSEEDLQQLALSFPAENLQPASAKWLKLGSETYCVSALRGSDYGLTYLTLIPSTYLTETLLTSFAWYLVLLIIEFSIVITVAYLITKTSFHHIQEMIDLFSDAEKGIYPEPRTQIAKDEYDVILTNVIQLFLNTTFLDTRLKTQAYEKKVAELTALQTQINPHFLFNTLQTLDFEAQKRLGHASGVNEIISKLSDLLKYAMGDPSAPVTFS